MKNEDLRYLRRGNIAAARRVLSPWSDTSADPIRPVGQSAPIGHRNCHHHLRHCPHRPLLPARLPSFPSVSAFTHGHVRLRPCSPLPPSAIAPIHRQAFAPACCRRCRCRCRRQTLSLCGCSGCGLYFIVRYDMYNCTYNTIHSTYLLLPWR